MYQCELRSISNFLFLGLQFRHDRASVARRTHRKPLPPYRVQRRADSNARQGKTVGIHRGTLFGGTQAEIQDRKGWDSSDERPHGRDETGSCHRPKTHCRVVQGAIRQAKAEHTPPHAAGT